ncbi:hypothetical protein OIU79_023401 [Salix purpurea]|uniref:Folate receptor-like domain-containing protein n=1 Tax=Salix purpurea TaxID=77065 RepID=A0A9Q0W931_SALPP|nr:hypothetical protein OIU79_023401 [Salix purpurea]
MAHFVNVGKPARVCVSKGGRFPPYSSEGKPPKKEKPARSACNYGNCWNAQFVIPKLVFSLDLLLYAASFCDRVYQACASAYFSMDANKRVLAPCGVNDFVCGQASEWVSNGTELCHAAGFAVKLSDDAYVDVEEVSCYGGRASLDSISDSWRSPDSPLSEFTQKAENIGVVEDFQQWVQEMQFIEKVSWAVGGLVLTAGLLFMSKRKSHSQSQRQKLAAIQRAAIAARRQDGRMRENSP